MSIQIQTFAHFRLSYFGRFCLPRSLPIVFKDNDDRRAIVLTFTLFYCVSH